ATAQSDQCVIDSNTKEESPPEAKASTVQGQVDSMRPTSDIEFEIYVTADLEWTDIDGAAESKSSPKDAPAQSDLCERDNDDKELENIKSGSRSPAMEADRLARALMMEDQWSKITASAGTGPV